MEVTLLMTSNFCGKPEAGSTAESEIRYDRRREVQGGVRREAGRGMF